MCTINSLVRVNTIPFLLSLVFILGLSILDVSANAPVRDDTGAPFAITVTAPADRVIEIKREGICDTLLSLPPASFNTTCLPVSSFQTITPLGTLNSNGGGPLSFPNGVYQIIYKITDACGAIGTDTMKLIVFDASPPDIVCIPEQIIYLNNTGEGLLPARSLDGGSSDDCGHVFYKVKRMSPPQRYNCTKPSNPNYNFDDEILMCCADAGQNIAVILRIYDVYPGDGPVSDSLYRGHFSDCMVMVTVGDKIPPTLNCPANITVSCGFDVDSLFKKQRPFILDNCSAVRLDSMIDFQVNGCGAGKVFRTFIATDRNGLSSSCTQTVHVQVNSHFDGTDPHQLKWPNDSVIYACRINADSIDAGSPDINEGFCDQIQIKKSDDVYYFSRGGVCSKIVRKWEVINWCNFNPYLLPNPRIPQNGYYSHLQIIKVMDSSAPVVIAFGDTTLFNYHVDCGPLNALLPDFYATDCGVQTGIKLSYEWDFFQDGKKDSTGNGSNPSTTVPMGIHNLYLIAQDSCHNFSSKKIVVTIKDAKSPTPNLLFGLSSNLIQMSTGPMIMVNSRLFDNKSFDNCTPSDKLRFSYSLNPEDTMKTFTCDEIGLQLFDLFVWDECGNYSKAQTYINITDSDSLCPSNLKSGFYVSGNIASYYGYETPEVRVKCSNPIINYLVSTDSKGRFNFPKLPVGTSCTLEGYLDEDYSEGVSTADIVRIQKHILGNSRINSPYDLIAADVDQSGSVTTRDLSLIRQLILGLITEFPKRKSLVTIPAHYQFSEPLKPWNEFQRNSTIEIDQIKTDQNIELIGIKLGDVTQSLGSGYLLNSNRRFVVEIVEHQGMLYFYSTQRISMEGIQFELNHPNGCKISIEPKLGLLGKIWSNNNFAQHENSIRVSMNLEQPLQINQADLLFVVRLEGLDIHCQQAIGFGDVIAAELYHANGEIYYLETDYKLKNKPASNDVFHIKSWGPNPFNEFLEFEISNPALEKIQYSIMDVYGKLVEKGNIKSTLPFQTLRLDQLKMQTSQVYIIVFENDSQRIQFKLIHQ